MAALRQRVQQALASRRERQMLRSLAPASEAQSDEQQQQMVDFSSNDYLSFARSPALRRRFLDAVNDPRQAHEGPYGPPSSRLLDGNSRAHRVLEDRLTSFFRGDAGLLFNSGFDANVGLWTCLPAPEDFVVYDELVHASTHDGMRASRVPRASRRSFKHNSVEHLAAVLRELKETHEGVRTGVRSVWIGVETVYSMDGTVARLGEMVDVAERILERGNVHFVVDEAHSTGLYGPQGRGLVCALGLANRITIRLHTFGKAMACSGAVVLCNPLLRHYLINYARPLIYSTVMPHVNVLLISCALDMLLNGESDQRAARVHDLANYLIATATPLLSSPSSPVTLPASLQQPTRTSSSSSAPTTSSIVPLLAGSRARALATALQQRGLLVRPVTYPTVPLGEERVRVCLHADNTREEVDSLLSALKDWIARLEQEEDQTPVQARL